MRRPNFKEFQKQQQSEQLSESEQENESDDQSQPEKRKKKINRIPKFVKNQVCDVDTDLIVINISRTHYEIIEQVAQEMGWRTQKSKKSQKWDIMWIDSHIESHDLFRLNDHQKISHFPAIYVLTKKNYLGRSLMKMRNFFPDQYNFFPFTWTLPSDYTQLRRFDTKHKQKQEESKEFYIYKPQAMAQGKGIKLYSNLQLLQGKNGIIQQYVNNPFLVENLKFDLRIYVLIMGYDPLRIFIYDEGLSRFATEKYQRVKKKNMKDVHMHLTNYAINKNSKKFIFNDSDKQMDKGHKRSLSAIYNYLSSQGIDVATLKAKIDDMVVKTLVVGQPMIAHPYGLAQSDNYANDLCFQILGFDVLINENLEPILLEVNHTPSFKTDTPLDKFIKKNLIKDTLTLLNVNVSNKKQKVSLKRQLEELRSQRKLMKLSSEDKQEFKKKKWKQRDQYQLANLGNFRKIFPTKHSSKYQQMIQVSTKIFNEAHGIKNKTINAQTKLFFTSRPKSLDRLKRNESITATISKYESPTKKPESKRKMFKIKECSENQEIKESLKLINPRLPSIGFAKSQQRKNTSQYIATTAKQKSFLGKVTQRLERTNSYTRNVKLGSIEPVEIEMVHKGSYLSPKLMEMNEHLYQQKSAELISSTSFSPTKINNNRLSNMSKGRVFQDVVNEACFQISSMTNKVTYENILNSLNSQTIYSNENKIKSIRKI